MKIPLSTATGLAVLALTVVLVSQQARSKRTAAPHSASPVVAGEKRPRPAKTPAPKPTEPVLDPDRFEGLDPAMQEVALRLEAEALEWRENQKRAGRSPYDWNAWYRFSLERIKSLESSQIYTLVVWLNRENSFNSTEIDHYRKALYIVWASRDPATARATMIANAKAMGLLDGQNHGGLEGVAPAVDQLSDDFHHVRVGHAMGDPAAGWQALLADEADPRMEYLVNVGVTLPDLFYHYAAQRPEEAWQLILSQPDEEHRYRMIEGFTDGAPPGQDWHALSQELAGSLRDRGIEPQHSLYRLIAARWVAEDPDAALEWYADHAGFEDLPQPLFQKPDPPRPSEGEIRIALKVDVLKSLFDGHRDHDDWGVRTMDALITQGQVTLGGRAIAEIVGDCPDVSNFPLLDSIQKIDKLEVRVGSFLKVVHALHPRDPELIPNFPIGDPTPFYEKLRSVTDQLDLPTEARTEVERVFAEFRAGEAENRRKEEESNSTQ